MNTRLYPPSRVVVWLAAIAAVLVGGKASAQEPWYTGVTLDNARISVARTGDAFSYDLGSSAFGYALRGGLRITKHIGVDFALQHTSDLEWTESSASVSGVPGLYDNHVTFDTNDLQASGVGILPFAKIWEAFVRVGIDFQRHRGQQVATSPLGSPLLARSISGDDITYVTGVGIGVTVEHDWHLRLEFQSLGLDESMIGVGDNGDAFAWVTNLAFGVERRFGRRGGDSQPQ
jgi:outer membrane protein with beta-barrel domain